LTKRGAARDNNYLIIPRADSTPYVPSQPSVPPSQPDWQMSQPPLSQPPLELSHAAKTVEGAFSRRELNPTFISHLLSWEFFIATGRAPNRRRPKSDQFITSLVLCQIFIQPKNRLIFEAIFILYF